MVLLGRAELGPAGMVTGSLCPTPSAEMGDRKVLELVEGPTGKMSQGDL